MDAMDIFGALLGKKSGSGSIGGKILKEMLGGSRGGSTGGLQSPSSSQPRRSPSGQSQRPRTLKDAASSLEDLLGVSRDHHHQRRQPQQAPTSSRVNPPSWSPPQKEQLDEQAKVLIRAMISAAKSDGQVTQDEQDAILKQLEHVSEEEIAFLRSEFQRPVDVKELAWSIPQGLEDQAYQISLIAIDLDEQKEAEYLADLAHGLRISPRRCNEIHTRLGAPEIFRAS